MHKLLRQMLDQIRIKNAKRRRRHVAVLILSLFVASGVLWQLKITGITMTGEALCGYLEHQHTAECVEKALTCGLEEAEPHTHTEECLGENMVLSCGQAEAEPHTHTEACVGEQLVCGQEEAEPHAHTEECVRQTLSCGQAEAAPHTHTEECVEQRLTCGQEESEDHGHSEECYTAEYTCGLEETPGHSHSDACYTQEYICGKEATEGHSHSAACYVQGYICGLEETEGHIHSDACYTREYICGLEETEGHAHTDACYSEVYVCGHEEHVHSLLCYSDRNADLETSSDWEATLPGLTGDPAADLVAVARSQIGYTESQRNYVVSDDGSTQRGYTRYGEWYGNPYGNWGAMFVSFCLNYAEHPVSGLASSGVETMRLAAVSLGYSRDAGYLPNPGDLVFLDRDGNGAADGVAVVTGWNEESFTAVEGDYGDAVQELSYAVDSSVILAYARLTESDRASFALPRNSEDDIALTSETGETITIQYVINNSAYTSDPGSGETHITVSSKDGLDGKGGLTYTKWSGRYKVTGTGTMISYEIPAGTSVSGSGFSAPKVTVEHIGSGNTNSYSSSYNWVTDSGMLCTDGMVFSSDTTLHLCLYGTEESYSLNWVCNCDNGGTHSVTYYVSVANAVFVPGQSLSAAYIPSAEQVNSKYVNTKFGCTAGPDHGMALQGWYLKTADGTEVPLTVGTPLTTDYADPNATRTIKVYARWTDAEAEPVTATFVSGETTIATVALTSGTALGENLPDAPTAPEGKIFVGWQAEGADGTSYYATAETVLTADTTFTAVFADKVTATFMNGEEVVETRYLAAGSVLGELPEGPEAPEDQSFLGWQAEGTTDYVTAETVINANTTYIAVFGYLDLCDVYFHDIDPNGDEYSGEDNAEDGGVASISLAIPQGAILQNWLVDEVLQDGTMISDCVWYTMVDGVKTRIDPANTVVEGDMDLYTYTYRITLTLNPQSAQTYTTWSMVDVTTDDDSGTLTMTITAREGEPISASDFVVDGVDYSLYTWTYTDSNNTTQTLNISSLIANGVTGNITATSTGELSGVTERTKNINFYVCINKSWVLIKSGEITAYSSGGSDYLSAAQLEAIYGPYGFTADQLNSASVRPFPHTDVGNGTIWSNRGPTQFNGVWFSPILTTNDGRACDVYYAPGYTGTNNASKSDLTTDYTFYTVTISDPLNWVYSSADNIPPVSYVFTGGDATVTVPMPEDENTVWQANGVTLTNGVDNRDGTITYTIENVTAPIVITPHRQGSYVVTYDINLTSTPVGTAPTINGESTYVDVFDSTTGESYVVLTPSKTEYTRNGDNSLVTLTFAGWDTDGDGTADLQAGQVLTQADLAAYADSNGNIELTAVWTDLANQGSVSFYVNLKCEVVDYGGGSTPTTSNNDYTSTLYGTSVSVSPEPSSYPSGNTTGAGGGIVIDGTDTAEVDVIIRQFASGSISASYGPQGDYIERAFELGSFPDDELILAQIRTVQAAYIQAYLASGYSSVEAYRTADPEHNKIIAIDGDYVPAEEITSENFTVRWYVFKYDATNGWHVDGVLVKKQGQLTVTKTFYGNQTAVTAAKAGYSISVNDGSSDIYTLNLNAKSDENPTGYTAYDSATDTYTWTIPLTAGRQFTLTENNFRVADTIVPGVTMASVPEYMVTNTDSQSTVPRTAYTGGVTVTAKAYSVDLNYTNYQTVKFYNSYLPTNVMMLSKVDDYGNPLSGVQFQLKYGGQVKQLYRNSDGYYYIYHEDGTEAVADNCITTDSQGNAIIVGLKDKTYAGLYTLTEVTPPAGYTAIGDIEFNADSSGNITLTEHPNATLVGDGLVIRVKNTSETISVTAVKEWSDSTNKPVKVTLCLDGTPMAGYEVELKAANNWTYTWDDLPAYVGGSLGSYTLRETWIGDTAYSATVDDGYEDYVVTYAKASYTYDTDGKPETLTLKVTNRTYSGGVEFTKVDENNAGLAGATFQLYSDPECTAPYGSAVTSDASGRVSFGSLAAGTYYMKETQVPDNYKSNATIYQIRVTGSGTTIKVYDPENNETVGDALTTIRNEPATASLLVQKVDESNNPLTGAKFELYKGDEKVTIGIQTAFEVDANGQLTFQDLAPGSYTLRETGAPAGYYRLAEDIPFTVADGSITCTSSSGKWSFSNTDNTFTITVTNVAGSELPHTGGMGTLYGTMVGLLMMAGSLYAILLRRKRERGAV